MGFKKWLETLAGPGGGPQNVERPDLLAGNNASHGVGAFPTYSDDELPPTPKKFCRKSLSHKPKRQPSSSSSSS